MSPTASRASNPIHPLAGVLDAASRGSFPPGDGVVEVLASTGGKADALVAFTGHFVLAADVDPAEVSARVPAGAFDVPLSPPFLQWLSGRLGRLAASHDAVLVAAGESGPVPPDLTDVDAVDLTHPRALRAARHRDDLRAFATPDGAGLLLLGRGLVGRWEASYEVEPGARNAGLGRRLVAAARRLVPAGEPVWLQIAPGNAASLRSAIAAGFRPVGAEVLFPRDGGDL